MYINSSSLFYDLSPSQDYLKAAICKLLSLIPGLCNADPLGLQFGPSTDSDHYSSVFDNVIKPIVSVFDYLTLDSTG